MDLDAVSIHTEREKRQSFSNDRALNPTASETEQESLSSTDRAKEFGSYLNKKFEDLSFGMVHEEIGIDKITSIKFSNAGKTLRLPPAQITTPRRQTTPSKIPHIGSKRDSVSICEQNSSCSSFCFGMKALGYNIYLRFHSHVRQMEY